MTQVAGSLVILSGIAVLISTAIADGEQQGFALLGGTMIAFGLAIYNLEDK